MRILQLPILSLNMTFAALLGMAAISPAPAQVLVDWNSSTWSNGAFSISTNGGTDTTTSGGVTVGVTYARSGTATSDSGNLSVSTVLSGGSSTPSLRMQQSNDANASSQLDNYSSLTLTFSQAVTLDEAITIFDVDRDSSNNWQDFIAVEARLGGPTGTLVTVNYTTTANNGLETDYGLAGVIGLNSVANSSPDGNVGVLMLGGFDWFRLIFSQPEGAATSNSHGIGISNVEASVVPEPATGLLLSAGLGFLFLHRGRKCGARASFRTPRTASRLTTPTR